MFKIWLTCLQPSLGILGALLVLSNAVSVYAASKTPGILTNKISKGQSQQKAAKPPAQPQKFGTKGAGIVVASTPLQGVRFSSPSYVGPDDAVRRLALDTIAKSDSKAPNLATKTPQQNSSGLASFIPPSTVRVSSVSTKSASGLASFIPPSTVGVSSISTKSAKVTATSHHLNSPATPLVSGVFIGNTSSTFDPDAVNFPNLALPSKQPVLPVVAKSLPTTATTIASTKVAEPVVQPEHIEQLGSTKTVVAPQSDDRSATSIAKGLEQFLGDEPQSVVTASVPDTTVAKGLEQFLGNEPKSIRSDNVAPIAEAIPVKTDSIPSLSELVSPKAAQRNTSAASLQLATSKSYDSSADFDLPGVATQFKAVKIAQPKVKLLVVKTVKTVKTNLSTAVVQRKKDYVALMSDEPLKSQSSQSWTTVSQSNSLGGLILGTRSTNEIASLPMKVLKANKVNGLGIFAPENQY
jgi:hypothetical protein